MKARVEHRVPLTDHALGILRYMRSMIQSQYVFPGKFAGRPLSNMTLLMMMKRMGRPEVPHGFRSTFKDWASECTDFPGMVSEMALAHAVKDKTEAAYRRGDLFEKRIALMNEWAAFCLSKVTSPAARAGDRPSDRPASDSPSRAPSPSP
jgi:integrase